MKSKTKVKTRKNRSLRKRHKQSKRLYGGLNSRAEKIMKTVEQPDNANGEKKPTPAFVKIVFEKMAYLMEGILIESINQLSKILGVDISDPKQVKRRLEEIKVLLMDPEIRAKVIIIVERLAIISEIALEAAEPYMKPLAKKVNKIYVDSTSELGESTVQIIKNVIKAIPGINVIASLIDLVTTASTAALDTAKAKKQIDIAVSKSLEATSINYLDLLKEKNELLKRTGESMKEFDKRNEK